MAKSTFTEGRLSAFEQMMQSVPGRMKEKAPQEQKHSKERLKKRQFRKK